MAGFTGQGSSVAITFADASTPPTLACIRSITMPTFSQEAIDASCLSDTGFMKKIAGDLTDGGQTQVTVAFLENDSALVASLGKPGTLTVTLPDGGILSGTGFITENTMPTAEINGLLEQSFTWTYDGETGPTYTPGT